MSTRPTIRRHFDWLAAGFAGIWLVFLLFPITQLLTNNQLSNTEKTLGLVAVVTFALTYLASYGAPWVLPGKKTWHRTLRWSLLLLIPTAALTYAVGPWWLYFFTYIVAMWAFQTPPRIGLTVGTFVTVLSTLVMVVYYPRIFQQGGYGFITGAFFVLVMAALSAGGDARVLRREQQQRTEQAERIASDVHDILGRSLTVINLKAELASALVEADPARAQQEMQEVSELSRTALAEVRATVTRLKTPTFTGEILASARALETAGIKAHLPSEQEAQVPGTNSVLFSWALREGVTNIIRHSGAENCRVKVEAERLEIVDDGVLSLGHELIKGNGLTGLEQRVKDSGGDLLLETGGGTRLLVTMNGDTSPLGA